MHDVYLQRRLETTAHALAATLVFLSIYEDIQQDVYDQIKEVLDGRSEAVSRPDVLSHHVSHASRLLRITHDSARCSGSFLRFSECSVGVKSSRNHIVTHYRQVLYTS